MVSYVWVHSTSELDPENPIIVFCYELTRNTEHLRQFYLNNGFEGTLTSDAYSAYGLLEKESNGTIVSCGCFMHVRRKFYNALCGKKIKDMTEKQLAALPESIVLSKIQNIYNEETPLKQLTAEERLAVRQQKIRPLVDDLFSYIKDLKENWNNGYGEALLDAVNYAINCETMLRHFLDDPIIPIDNGSVERVIRPFTVGRRNWLFCYSIRGAETSSILYSLSETALANGAHPYYYFKFLLESLPKYKSKDFKNILPNMMPWSEAYKTYEAEQKQAAVAFWTDTEPVVPPKAPKQNRKRATIA